MRKKDRNIADNKNNYKKYENYIFYGIVLFFIFTMVLIYFQKISEIIAFLAFTLIIFISYLYKSFKIKCDKFIIDDECKLYNKNIQIYEKLVELRNNIVYWALGFIATIFLSGSFVEFNREKLFKFVDLVGIINLTIVSFIFIVVYKSGYNYLINQIRVYEKLINVNSKFENMEINNLITHLSLGVYFTWLLFALGGLIKEVGILRNVNNKKISEKIIKQEKVLIEKLELKEIKYIETINDSILNKKLESLDEV